MVLLEEADQSTIRSRITGMPGSGLSTTSDGNAQVCHAGQTVLAVDVHRVGSAHAFAARTAKTQAWIDSLDPDQSIEQHAVAVARLEVVGLHARRHVAFEIATVDVKASHWQPSLSLRALGKSPRRSM
jgi:hypothetical protein